MCDHTKLRRFELADEVVLLIYRAIRRLSCQLIIKDIPKYPLHFQVQAVK